MREGERTWEAGGGRGDESRGEDVGGSPKAQPTSGRVCDALCGAHATFYGAHNGGLTLRAQPTSRRLADSSMGRTHRGRHQKGGGRREERR
jgi:hypothetical protein